MILSITKSETRIFHLRYWFGSNDIDWRNMTCKMKQFVFFLPCSLLRILSTLYSFPAFRYDFSLHYLLSTAVYLLFPIPKLLLHSSNLHSFIIANLLASLFVVFFPSLKK